MTIGEEYCNKSWLPPRSVLLGAGAKGQKSKRQRAFLPDDADQRRLRDWLFHDQLRRLGGKPPYPPAAWEDFVAWRPPFPGPKGGTPEQWRAKIREEHLRVARTGDPFSDTDTPGCPRCKLAGPLPGNGRAYPTRDTDSQAWGREWVYQDEAVELLLGDTFMVCPRCGKIYPRAPGLGEGRE